MALADNTASRNQPLVADPTEQEWLQGLRGRRFRKLIPIAIGMVMVVIMILSAILAPIISPLSPSAQFSDFVLSGPMSGKHLLGTDEFGRDLLSRIIWGTRVSLQVGVGAVIVGFIVGVPLGILAGFSGGGTEAVILRFTDMLLAFPTLLLALIIVTALGGSLLNEIIAIGVALTPNFIRLARSLALTIRENDYIMAARAIGSSPIRLMARHVFPNTISTLVVIATLYIANAIRTEAGLSFLGLGVPPPTPSWGNILSEGRQYIQCCPWLTTFSGLAIMLAVLAFNVMGDALRDLLDPRLRGE
ncbi:MAG: ABC transporter permease [Candidatus Tectomicrobia bacterium]|nr:ABC transporter permease [Candidatus Tectomicrobia bacterium]